MKNSIFIATLIVYTLLVGYLSLIKPSGVADIGAWDKFAHALAYLIFSIQAGIVCSTWRSYTILLAGFIMFGILIEYLQSLTSYRQASVEDIAANVIGLMLGSVIVATAKHFKKRQKNS